VSRGRAAGRSRHALFVRRICALKSPWRDETHEGLLTPFPTPAQSTVQTMVALMSITYNPILRVVWDRPCVCGKLPRPQGHPACTGRAPFPQLFTISDGGNTPECRHTTGWNLSLGCLLRR